MKKVASIVLNRNLPAVTDSLCEKLEKHNGELTDIFVVEAGSDDEKLSRYCSWHATWPEARSEGLRVPRGFNFGLANLYKQGDFGKYDYFLLLTNDTEFSEEPIIDPLCKIMSDHPRLGILSPCSRRWGEKELIPSGDTRYFWYVHNTAFLLRREFVESVADFDEPSHMRFLYDGVNFRGYHAETELITKGYANDWATGITTAIWAEENEKHLVSHSDLIKTDSYEKNLSLYVEEGKIWMKKKYGFNSRWQMQMYAKFWYDRFFEFYPEYEKYRI